MYYILSLYIHRYKKAKEHKAQFPKMTLPSSLFEFFLLNEIQPGGFISEILRVYEIYLKQTLILGRITFFPLHYTIG